MACVKTTVRTSFRYPAAFVDGVLLALGLSGCASSDTAEQRTEATSSVVAPPSATDTGAVQAPGSGAPAVNVSGPPLNASAAPTTTELAPPPSASSPPSAPSETASVEAPSSAPSESAPAPTVNPSATVPVPSVAPVDTVPAPSVAPTEAPPEPETDTTEPLGDGGGPNTDPSGPVPDPEMGPNDELAARACTVMAGAELTPGVQIQTIEAVIDQQDTELAGSMLKVDGSVLYRITLPEGQPGYVRLDEDTWDALVAFHTHEGTAYEVLHAAVSPRSNAPLKNGACPDSTLRDYRVMFSHWSTADLRFSAEGPRQVDLLITKMPGVGTPAQP
jgi:hypothetical protein